MKITVSRIRPLDEKYDFLWAVVNFWDESGPPHASCEVDVPLPLTDIEGFDIEAIKALAVQRGKELLLRFSTPSDSG